MLHLEAVQMSASGPGQPSQCGQAPNGYAMTSLLLSSSVGPAVGGGAGTPAATGKGAVTERLA